MITQVLADRSLVNQAETAQPAEITSSTLLIADETPLPGSLDLATEPYSGGWSIVTGSGASELDKQLRTAGWHFFHLASDVAVTAFGVPGQGTLRRAVKRVIATMVSSRYNCVEIESIYTGRVLGIPYTKVSARPRHIQQAQLLSPRLRHADARLRTGSYV